MSTELIRTHRYVESDCCGAKSDTTVTCSCCGYLLPWASTSNVLVLVVMISPEIETLKRKHEVTDFGWKHWFHHT